MLLTADYLGTTLCDEHPAREAGVRIVKLVLVVTFLAPGGLSAQSIFADGFETGGLLRWSGSVGAAWEDECNLVAQTGCLPGERCTFIITSFNPLEGYAGCAGDGSTPAGGSCAVDGDTGIDDCLAGLVCQGGICKPTCTLTPDSCPSSEVCWGFASTFDGQTVAACSQRCDLFAQDCPNGESCFILLGRDGYPTLCIQAIPEPAPPDGCGDGLPPPGAHGECCSFVNTCSTGHGCNQPNAPTFDHSVCARNCDPTGTLGWDDCAPVLGSDHWCLSMNDFYADLDDLEDAYGFCVDQRVWGPPQCFNGIQDGDEDGIDCCIEPGGNPSCPCTTDC